MIIWNWSEIKLVLRIQQINIQTSLFSVLNGQLIPSKDALSDHAQPSEPVLSLGSQLLQLHSDDQIVCLCKLYLPHSIF